MSNQKQLTAVQMLRDKLQTKQSSCTNYDANQVYSSLIELIDTELLANERQQLIDFHTTCCKNGLERENEKYNDEDVDLIKQHANDYYNNTFKQ